MAVEKAANTERMRRASLGFNHHTPHAPEFIFGRHRVSKALDEGVLPLLA